ncbi:hypothetical protein B0G57_14210 [Trinickia symbiotica]|nr:hypothetical protein B0G57_14210 [Trinickia symbiotica]
MGPPRNRDVQYRENRVTVDTAATLGRRRPAAPQLAERRGWLKPDAPVLDDVEIAAALGPPQKAMSTA